MCDAFSCPFSHTGCPGGCRSRIRVFTYRITEDTAGTRWISKFEAGCTAPVESWQEIGDDPGHFSLDPGIHKV